METRLTRELAPRPYAQLTESEKLARLWEQLPGYVAATARREGITPRRVCEQLAERLPDDEAWWSELGEYDAAARAAGVAPNYENGD